MRDNWKNLLELQQEFQDYILENAPAMCAEVVATPEVSVETRLGIYSYAYSARLVEVLEADFTGLQALVGEEEFHQLGHAYLQAYPSVYRSVRWFATHLTNFLQNQDPYCRIPAFAEMAEFEWTLQYSLDAADGKIATAAEVMLIPAEKWPAIHLNFHPSLQRLDLQWNVASIWQAVEADTEIPQLQEAGCPAPWVIWRSEDQQVLFKSMSIEEAWALDTLAAGHSFDEMCEGLCEWIDEEHAGPHAAGLLKIWLDHGMISEVIY